VTILAPEAEPRWAADAVADADLVVLAIPLHRFVTFDPSLVAGKLVVDTTNYWPPVDGVVAMFEDRRPRGSPQRRALGIAGDDPAAVDTVAEVMAVSATVA
jgi:hypothetical protein